MDCGLHWVGASASASCRCAVVATARRKSPAPIVTTVAASSLAIVIGRSTLNSLSATSGGVPFRNHTADIVSEHRDDGITEGAVRWTATDARENRRPGASSISSLSSAKGAAAACRSIGAIISSSITCNGAAGAGTAAAAAAPSAATDAEHGRSTGKFTSRGGCRYHAELSSSRRVSSTNIDRTPVIAWAVESRARLRISLCSSSRRAEPHCRLTLLLFHIGFMPVDVVFRYSRLVVSATGNRAAAASIL